MGQKNRWIPIDEAEERRGIPLYYSKHQPL